MLPPELPVGERLHARLTWHGMAAGSDAFALHVVGSILGIAAQECAEAGTLHEAAGLDPVEMRALFALLFPEALPLLRAFAEGAAAPSADEAALRDLLWMHAGEGAPLEHFLVRMVARRSMRPNHLWQDLGLGSRRELGALMQRYFPRLARKNGSDMKWKKFFYRMLCSAAEFRLCTAPVCSECDDFDACFGAEDGESLLARARRAAPMEMRL
jgi:nitrogen fixation protein NifQ